MEIRAPLLFIRPYGSPETARFEVGIVSNGGFLGEASTCVGEGI